MLNDLPIGEARQLLNKLPEQLGEDPESGALSISRRGTPVLAVLSWDLYQSIIETLEILGDEQLTESIRQGIKEIEAGKGIPWDEAKATLDR
jgi:PHD/YefM family antitoxin component YafN of YafNO toxin-antitoxin module